MAGIDPGIIGIPATRQGGYSPLAALAKADLYSAQEQKRKDDQAARQDQEVMSKIAQQYPDDPDTAIKVLRAQGFIGAAAAMEKQVTEHRTKMVEMRGKELENLFKQGQISEQQVKAEAAALQRGALEDWVALYDIDPQGAAEKARFLLGPEKLATIEGQAAQRALTARGQDMTAATAEANRGVTIRGQDLSASTARRGQDITARGQDLSAKSAANRLALDKAQGAAGGAGGVKLSAGQQQDIEAMLTLSDMAKEVRALGDQTGWEGTGGLGSGSIRQFMANATGKGSPQNISLRNKVGNIRATIAKLRGGTAFTPNEQKLLDSYTPSIDDADVVLTQKLSDLEGFIELKRKNMLRVAQGDLSPNSGPVTAGGGSGGKMTAEELIKKYGGG